MSHSSTVMAGALKPRLRHMSKRELPDGLQTNPRGRWLDGVDDPPEGRLRERVGWVAEVQGRVAGSMVYDVVRSTTAPQDAGSQRCLLEVLRRFLGRHEARPLHVELLDVTVGPSPYWEAVERLAGPLGGGASVLLRSRLGGAAGKQPGSAVVPS